MEEKEKKYCNMYVLQIHEALVLAPLCSIIHTCLSKVRKPFFRMSQKV